MSQPATKRVLTDRGLKAMKPAPEGKRDVYWDAAVPSFGIRVTDKGQASFFIMRRLDGKLLRWTLASFSIGNYPVGMLAQAREEARAALRDVQRGVDPKQRHAAELREKARERENTFSAVADDFVQRHAAKLRSATTVEKVIRREMIPRWGKRPITDIGRRDVVELLEEIVDSKRPAVAHQVLAYARGLFNWAIERSFYGLEHSPCDRISAARTIGEPAIRDRVLFDDEIQRLWRATDWTSNDAGALGYPFAPMVRLLLITGQRLREVAEMSWDEIDLGKALWTIPAKRMKGGEAHEVPLSTLAVELLNALPRWKGLFVFTTTGGEKAVSGFSKAKARLDKLLVTASADETPQEPTLPRWTFHDLRRTMRTNLSGLPVPDLVAELVIAHRKPGLHRVYDLHSYREEKRLALEMWSSRLATITSKPVAPTCAVELAARHADAIS